MGNEKWHRVGLWSSPPASGPSSAVSVCPSFSATCTQPCIAAAQESPRLLELSVGLHQPPHHSDVDGRGRRKTLQTPKSPFLWWRFPQPSCEGYPRGLGSPSTPEQPPQAKKPIFSAIPRVKQPLTLLQEILSAFLHAAKLLWTDRQVFVWQSHVSNTILSWRD